MKVNGVGCHFPDIRGTDLLQRKVKQAAVVGLKFDGAVRDEDPVIACQKL